jgi:HEXXH motif-containing protein
MREESTQRSSADSGLLLPAGDGPSARIASLRRAEAWRLLKAHATSDVVVARALAALARAAPAEAVDVLMEPATAVLARAGQPIDAGDAWMLELARRDRIERPFALRGRRVVSGSLELALAWDADVRVAVVPGALEIAGRGANRSIPLTRDALLASGEPRLRVEPTCIRLADRRGVLRFGLVDTNPLAMFETHPDKDGNALSLGGHDATEWTGALDDALAIVDRHLPRLVDEMTMLSFSLVPVGYHAEKHVSASYREYVGACYLTLHPDVATLAEAIVHEFQHNKANLASYHDDLLENAHTTQVRSPVRPDLRPLWGVLLAIHAFIPVAELYRRMLAAGEGRVERRLRDVLARNDEGLRTVIEHAKPTRVGAMLIDELAALHGQHVAFFGREAATAAGELTW